ncbi:ABC transporter substrate-binding protein [Geodermatophilus sp. DSM 44513]|uniref:ABC transporter substrate-binding protein n=1 Tax=Geodermatophilus sp. DSM 44513 TaxID=1528104 RepID=UPI0028F74781|nr:ABC transporter substrate-binding protein [Geodermatophilus sp. DSM 44513]WNV75082.1 ABC transporter substrate-binding protein [Geodermatophilus sp. DSM 44513]
MPAGMLLAMTGQGSFFGEVMSSGAKLAAAQINAAEGFDYQINIADHKSGDVPAALSGVREMTSRNGIKILQTSYGAPSEAIVPLIEQNKLLSFNGGGSSPGQVGKPFLYQTRMIFGDDPTPGMLAWLNENYPDAKRLAIVGTQENGVLGRTEIAPRVWTQLTGGEVVASEQHDVGATDFRSVVARVKSATPDAIVTYSFGDDVGYLVKQLREANVTVPVMGIEFTDQAAAVAGETYDTYNFATDYYDVNNPNPWNKIFVEGYREAYGEDPEYYGANYYEQVFWTWELVRRVIADGGDPMDTEQLEQALIDDPTFPSLYGGSADEVGRVEFDVQEHTISKPMAVFQVEGGKPVQLQAITKVDDGADPRSALVKE